MYKDIILTTPQKDIQTSIEEAIKCRYDPNSYYFRTFKKRPTHLDIGSKLFYIENNYIRGYAVVFNIIEGNMDCTTTNKDWGYGTHALMRANSWKWIKPIQMKGFRNWRYFNQEVKIIGDWLDPKPTV